MEQHSQMAVEFVKRLAIEVDGSERLWRPESSAALQEDRKRAPGAYVVAASVVTFTDGIYGQQREDLLNSCLLAQLSANKQHDRERATLDWYAHYRKVLLTVGWRVDEAHAAGTVASGFRSGPKSGPGAGLSSPLTPGPMSGRTSGSVSGRVSGRASGSVSGPVLARPSRQPVVGGRLPRLPAGPAEPVVLPVRPGQPTMGERALTFKPVVPQQPRFTAETTVLALLQRKVQAKALLTTEAALDKLRRLDDRDRRAVIFETSSHKGGSGSFQIISASAVSDTAIRMTIAAFFFATDDNVTRLLSFNFGKSNTTMYQACDTLTLDSADYAPVRDQVIEQLGDQALTYIAEIDLGS